jgi:hypothetical protein
MESPTLRSRIREVKFSQHRANPAAACAVAEGDRPGGVPSLIVMNARGANLQDGKLTLR